SLPATQQRHGLLVGPVPGTPQALPEFRAGSSGQSEQRAHLTPELFSTEIPGARPRTPRSPFRSPAQSVLLIVSNPSEHFPGPAGTDSNCTGASAPQRQYAKAPTVYRLRLAFKLPSGPPALLRSSFVLALFGLFLSAEDLAEALLLGLLLLLFVDWFRFAANKLNQCHLRAIAFARSELEDSRITSRPACESV